MKGKTDTKKGLEEKMMSDGGTGAGEIREGTPSDMRGTVETLGDEVDRRALSLDPQSCFFEGQFYANNEDWVPQFDKSCTICKCVVRIK